MSHTVHAFDYLAEPQKYPAAAVCVVFGDEPFLKRLALRRLRDDLLGADADDVPYATFEGKTAQWRDVIDELSTVSLFGGGASRGCPIHSGGISSRLLCVRVRPFRRVFP